MSRPILPAGELCGLDKLAISAAARADSNDPPTNGVGPGTAPWHWLIRASFGACRSLVTGALFGVGPAPTTIGALAWLEPQFLRSLSPPLRERALTGSRASPAAGPAAPEAGLQGARYPVDSASPFLVPSPAGFAGRHADRSRARHPFGLAAPWLRCP